MLVCRRRKLYALVAIQSTLNPDASDRSHFHDSLSFTEAFSWWKCVIWDVTERVRARRDMSMDSDSVISKLMRQLKILFVYSVTVGTLSLSNDNLYLVKTLAETVDIWSVHKVPEISVKINFVYFSKLKFHKNDWRWRSLSLALLISFFVDSCIVSRISIRRL